LSGRKGAGSSRNVALGGWGRVGSGIDLAPWVYVAHSQPPSIWLIDGVATVKNADDQTIAKLFALAQQLGARVVGGEGEE
jgi:hypothetical protein